MGKHIHRARLEWSWGADLYKVVLDGRVIRVTQPAWKWNLQSEGRMFNFEWEDSQTYSAVRDEIVLRTVILLNETLIAEISSASQRSQRIGRASRTTCEVALLGPGRGTLTLCYRSFLGLSTGRFSLLNEVGQRKAYWSIVSCRFGGPSAVMLISRRLPGDVVPFFIAIALSTVIAFGTSDGA